MSEDERYAMVYLVIRVQVDPLGTASTPQCLALSTFSNHEILAMADTICCSFSDNRLNSTVIRNLTKTLILHPIAAALSGLAVIFGLCGARYHRVGTILMAIAALLAFLVTLVVWVIDMVLWGIVRSRIRDNVGSDSAAQYGNANWLTLGALVALALAFCTGVCGIFGRYRSSRRGGKV